MILTAIYHCRRSTGWCRRHGLATRTMKGDALRARRSGQMEDRRTDRRARPTWDERRVRDRRVRDRIPVGISVPQSTAESRAATHRAEAETGRWKPPEWTEEERRAAEAE